MVSPLISSTPFVCLLAGVLCSVFISLKRAHAALMLARFWWCSRQNAFAYRRRCIFILFIFIFLIGISLVFLLFFSLFLFYVFWLFSFAINCVSENMKFVYIAYAFVLIFSPCLLRIFVRWECRSNVYTLPDSAHTHNLLAKKSRRPMFLYAFLHNLHSHMRLLFIVYLNDCNYFGVDDYPCEFRPRAIRLLLRCAAVALQFMQYFFSVFRLFLSSFRQQCPSNSLAIGGGHIDFVLVAAITREKRDIHIYDV